MGKLDEMDVPRSYMMGLLTLPVKANIRLNPPTASSVDPVSVALDMMMKSGSGAVVVVDEGRPVGVITERDILDRVIRLRADLNKILARDAMSSPIITIEEDRSIQEALDLMRENNIRRLPVTRGGVLVGLTTERRLLRIVHERYSINNYNAIRDEPPSELVKVRASFVSTYPPRECGIATFTEDLAHAISRLHLLSPPSIVSINDKGSHYNYGDEVEYQIEREQPGTYVEAAEHVNDADIEIVNLQHEFGLFGGAWGEHILAFLERLEKPVVTTLHTVPLEPEGVARRVLEGILKRSDYIVVMAKVGIGLLEQLYETLTDKVRYIPHGCSNVPLIRPESVKQRLGLEGRIVLSTFGLISRGKGIEYAIQALPQAVEEEPRLLYLIIGETHPEVRKHEGESYRECLANLVNSLGLEGNVRFVNRFLRKAELIRYLQASDLYIIPYPNRDQISSGTLLYALSVGKAIVTTPFLHAEEVISQGCALECGFRDPESMAECVNTLIRHEDLRREFGRRAYEYSRGMIWPHIAMRYVNLFCEALRI